MIVRSHKFNRCPVVAAPWQPELFYNLINPFAFHDSFMIKFLSVGLNGNVAGYPAEALSVAGELLTVAAQQVKARA